MLLVGRSRSCRRPRALWFIIRSAACCSDSQSRKEERKEGRTGAGARARERRVRDLAGAQDVWKVDSALSVADADANGGRGIPATMRLVPFATRRRRHYRSGGSERASGGEWKGVRSALLRSVFQYRQVIGFMVINGVAAGGAERAVRGE